MKTTSILTLSTLAVALILAGGQTVKAADATATTDTTVSTDAAPATDTTTGAVKTETHKMVHKSGKMGKTVMHKAHDGSHKAAVKTEAKADAVKAKAKVRKATTVDNSTDATVNTEGSTMTMTTTGHHE